MRVAAAAAGAQGLEEVLELTAEEARRAIGAASLAISRWERDANVLRTLINVGELGPGWERYPEDEVYEIPEGSNLNRLLLRGQPYFNAVDDPAADSVSVERLRAFEKASEVAVPIMVEAESWGEVWAATAHGEPRFRAADVRFLEAIAGQLAVAIERAELFSRVSRLAYEDPLTGLANRRALEERLARSIARADVTGGQITVLLCDVDDLKAINDERGHDAGDRALRRVAEALVAAAADHPGQRRGAPLGRRVLRAHRGRRPQGRARARRGGAARARRRPRHADLDLLRRRSARRRHSHPRAAPAGRGRRAVRRQAQGRGTGLHRGARAGAPQHGRGPARVPRHARAARAYRAPAAPGAPRRRSRGRRARSTASRR